MNFQEMTHEIIIRIYMYKAFGWPRSEVARFAQALRQYRKEGRFWEMLNFSQEERT